MKPNTDAFSCMPDVALQPQLGCALDWVGMDGIDVPLLLADATRVTARAGAFVNLTRTDRRGIHMSRLYLLLDEHLGHAPLSGLSLERLLRECLASHADLSDRARVQLRFDQLARRKALRSDHHGWRAYPVTIDAGLSPQGFSLALAVDVTYSSTCPASAALARQLIQTQFEHDFDIHAPLHRDEVVAWLGSERGIVATPHAQRSIAQVRVQLAHGARLDAIDLIDRVEAALGTPVQTAVKREDEQAFALANGGNLMFCEDAARRIHRALHAEPAYVDFTVRVEHQESLHAHDAVAFTSRQPA